MDAGKRVDTSVWEYVQEMDAAKVLDVLAAAAGKRGEQYGVRLLLIHLAGHQVALIRILSAAFPEFAKHVPEFFAKRVEDYRRSMRLRQLLTFRWASSVEDEAVRKAWEDTARMVREISPMRDEAIRGLVEDHREVLTRLCRAMVELVMREGGGQAAGGWERLVKLLEGGRE